MSRILCDTVGYLVNGGVTEGEQTTGCKENDLTNVTLDNLWNCIYRNQSLEN